MIIWTTKEYRNLIRAHRAGVAVPKPLHQKENVLFMRFLGDNGWPSPQLREVEIKKGSDKWTTFYCQVCYIDVYSYCVKLCSWVFLTLLLSTLVKTLLAVRR